MANMKLTADFLAVTVLSATTESPGSPKENAVDRTSPMKAWRSTSIAADQRLVIDLGAAQTALDCYLDWVNFASFRYQESADGTSGWADVTSLLTVEKDPMHGVYRRRDRITITGKRYLGVLIPAQAPVDGAAYFRIGTIAFPINVVELDAATGADYPLSYSLPKTHVVTTQFPTGKDEKAKLTPLEPMVISVDFTTEVQGNIAGDPLEELIDQLRDDTRILYLDFNLGRTWQAYLVKREGAISATVDDRWGEATLGAQLFKVVT